MLINLLLNGGNVLMNAFLFLFVASALVISISIHEFAHALVADKLGDPTAKYLGRLTLKPKAHLDPVGTLMLLIAGFGWGKPVPFNPENLKNPRRDSALISLAGPVSNFLLATALALVLKIFPFFTLLHLFLYFVILYNLLLGFFNLIPVHPLDGFKIVNGFLPYHLSMQWIQLAPYGVYILLALVFTNALNIILDPLLNFGLRVLGLL